MSVLVHGVEMPFSCYGCNFWIAKRKPQSSYCCAAFVDVSEDDYVGRPHWCPLEEVEDEG